MGTSDSSGPGGTLPKSLFGYEVLDFIGEGAGSLIYVVSHPETKQLYALKHVVRKVDKDERFVEQLETEYNVGRTVSHAGLRKSIDLKINRTLLRKTIDAALVLELFDGQSLEHNAPKRMVQMLDVFVQIAKALEALHKASYVHCDLKPNNVLINGNGQIKVIDLGQTVRSGMVKQRIQGTPDYIAPEQVKCEAVTPKTDVYNLGATMYAMLTGKNVPTLFTLKKGDNSFLIDDKVPSPKDLNEKVPENLSGLVMDCVRINPNKRPEMGDVVRRLEIMHYAAQRAAAASPTQPPSAGERLATV